ncbi:MAG: DUF3048 domain-containing protein [Patescibacteria group bacterium]
MSKKFSDKLKNFLWGLKKNKKALITTVIVVFVVGIGVLGYFVFRGDEVLIGNKAAEDTTEKVRRFIDGQYVTIDKANIYPVGIQIENLITVRPQHGLSRANLVYEALAEGGITRFLAIYASGDRLEKIGPVRSSRPYFLDWLTEFNAVYLHCGGSPQALSDIATFDVLSLNQIGGDHQYYWRDEERPRPHNLYTSHELIARAFRDKEFPEEGDYDPWLFKDEVKKSARPTEEKFIKVDFLTYSYEVEYKYDRNQNVYKRFQAGEAHSDELTKEQIAPKNVAVMYVDTELADESRLTMETIGEGEALVFQDGKAIEATWKKAARESRTRFYDKNDKEIRFNAGSTWIEVMPTDRTVEYN